MLYLSGSADPFASKSIRKFLLNLDLSKFPSLNHIHLHTNGLLLTEEIWNRLKHLHHLIKTVEVSVDAATKETYELIRRGGTWEILLNNLKFISTLNLKDVRTSFVVQDTNYLEMSAFYSLMMSIFNSKVDVYFNKITNWGTYTEGEFKIKQIWNETHPEFNLFLIQLHKMNKKFRCIHNMYDIMEKHLPNKLESLI
jgi:MoaA/NifB/PqqE/SkfB family radical SAM enzyme